MSQAEITAQAALRRIVEQLNALRLELLGVHVSLPVPPQETAMLLGEEEMDVSTEVRSIIECVLNDSIEPAIRDLQAAAAYQLEKKKGQKP
jgi:hypothetical protein